MFRLHKYLLMGRTCFMLLDRISITNLMLRPEAVDVTKYGSIEKHDFVPVHFYTSDCARKTQNVGHHSVPRKRSM